MPRAAARRDARALERRDRRRPRRRRPRAALTAECPVAWPSGAFVRVDRLDDEAKRGIEASARFAAGIGSPVLTIHLFVPMDPAEYRAHAALDEERRRRVPALLRRGLPGRGRDAADRERPARAADAHRRRLPLAGRRPLARPAAVVRPRPRPARRRSTPRTPRCSPPSPPPTRRCSGSPPTTSWTCALRGRAARRSPTSPTSPTPTGCSARGCPTAPASWTSTPWSAGSGERVPVHRRRDQRARPRALGRHEGRLPRDRAGAGRARGSAARGRSARLAASTRSTGRPCSAAATRCPPCSSCRSASAGGAC